MTKNFKCIVIDVLSNDFPDLKWDLFHDAHDRIEFDHEAISIVIRLTILNVRYLSVLLLVAITEKIIPVMNFQSMLGTMSKK